MNDGTTLELPTDREILITRSFAAPVAMVFDAITKPEHIRRWWAPRSRGEMLACEVDLRVGGRWRFSMRTLDGREVGFHGEYFAITAPTEIVHSEIFDPFPDFPARVTVTLRENDGVTVMTSRSVYPSKEVRDMVIASGMESGMRESMRQLSEVAESLR
jgi:uncharacterized protein YndB with AHSA1/START domain